MRYKIVITRYLPPDCKTRKEAKFRLDQLVLRLGEIGTVVEIPKKSKTAKKGKK